MKHTKGPWQVTPDKCRIQTSEDAPDFEIADCNGGAYPDIENIEANARLIAAAPELLEGLKDVFKMMDEQILVRNIEHDHKPEWAVLALSTVTRLKCAYDAIAKAEGES